MDTDQVMTQRKGMTAGGAGGGVAGLLENVAGLFIVVLLLVGLEKALGKSTE